MMFEKQKAEALYECAPIHVTDNGVVYIKTEELLNSRRFYDLLEAMLNIPCRV